MLRLHCLHNFVQRFLAVERGYLIPPNFPFVVFCYSFRHVSSGLYRKTRWGYAVYLGVIKSKPDASGDLRCRGSSKSREKAGHIMKIRGRTPCDWSVPKPELRPGLEAPPCTTASPDEHGPDFANRGQTPLVPAETCPFIIARRWRRCILQKAEACNSLS